MMDLEKQPKLLGFAGHGAVENKATLEIVLREEILGLRERMGPRTIAMASAASGADLVFLKCCVELRFPTVVMLPLPKECFLKHFKNQAERKLAADLMSVALAVYVVRGEEVDREVSRQLIDWADVFLFTCDGQVPCVDDARDLGIPSRIVDARSLIARWQIELDGSRAARHGFSDRRELLEFFDARFTPA